MVAYTTAEEEEKEGNGGENMIQNVFRKGINKKLDKYSTGGKRGAHIVCYIEIDQIATYDTTMYIIKNVKYYLYMKEFHQI